MGKKKPKYPVVDYYMSIHYGICHGPVDDMTRIEAKDKTAWEGTANVPAAHGISLPNLFGGDKKEGGLVGSFDWLPGLANQILPTSVASRLGLTPATAPGYRGIASVFFRGNGSSGGFLWASNNPYLQGVKVRVFRQSLGLDPGKAVIQRVGGPRDSNPAHMIYECLTNTNWGMGGAVSSIDLVAFGVAADTLFDEQFGLSMMWARAATIESFVTEILDHIQATLFIHPRTGLLTLKLIRDDYDINTLRHFDETNCDVQSRQRKSWGQTINEIVINWTNPENEQEESITFQDLGNISMQGGEIVSDARNYYGVRNVELATELGARDIVSASYPLLAVELEADRAGWDLVPGDVATFSWPEDGIEKVVLRVGNVDYGKPGSPVVKVSMVEDIFSLEQAVWAVPPTTGWVDLDEPPAVFAHTYLTTIPYPMVISAGFEADQVVYPQSVPALLAAQTGLDTVSFDVVSNVTISTGAVEKQTIVTLAPTPRIVMTGALVEEAQSIIAGDWAMIGFPDVKIGDFALLPGAGEDESEIIVFSAYNSGADTWTVLRGIWDTIPRIWPVGTQAWILDENFEAVDVVERSAGETVDYQLLPQTSLGILDLGLAPIESITLSERPYLPFRPANVVVAGSAFADTELTVVPVTIPVSWANRNRQTEDAVVQHWDDGDVTGEVGQTTTIRVEQANGTLIVAHTGLAGTSFDVPYAGLESHFTVVFKVLSVRDGFESLQAATVLVDFNFLGYGYSYGENYGDN